MRTLIALGILSLSAPAQDRFGGGEDASQARILPAQEEAVERGLAWLAKHQETNGSWSANVGFKLNSTYRITARDRGHVGVTALAGMAFLAGGNLPGRGKYGAEIEKALDFVLSCVQDDGYVTLAGTRMYSHAFATLFLAEIYGTTHREDVRVDLQRAVDFIVKCQNQEGGWRYVPLARESDMSIVVCQVLALRAARNIGIRVPKVTIDRAIEYVKESAVTTDSHRRNYSPYRNDLGTFHYQKDTHSRSNYALTAAGVTALHGLGIYSDDLIRSGVDYLNREVDQFNRNFGDRGHYFFWYGHYYGVQAMYTVGGRDWQNYFHKLRDFLIRRQQSDGSWRNQEGPGEAFSTAVGCLILEIPYCFLPIFQR